MREYMGETPAGELISYRDGKRWWWLLSVIFPLHPFVGIGLHASSGNEWWLLWPLAATFIGGTVLDTLLGEDRNNPPEALVPQLEQDHYYRRLTFLIVPVHLLSFYAAAWYAATQPVSPWGFAVIALVMGLTGGLAINTGHELGHKNSKFERALSKLALAIPAYGHFTIDHNRGHHRDVALPEDVASSRMGESIYRFATREIPGAVKRAWQIEKERLQSRQKPVWSHHNHILRGWALTVLLQGVLVLLFGWQMLPYLLIHNAAAWWQLTSANYVEHYGLLRQRDSNGRPERCQPHHSWNSNHLFSNLSLFHLERHSDHHTHPLRRYQSLRHFPDLPSLPTGYFGCYLLAYVPPLWYRVMDPKLMALPQVQGDLSKVNVDPSSLASLQAKYAGAG